MFCRNKKNRKYLAPYWKVTDVALESNFCTSVMFNVRVQESENMNREVDAEMVDTSEDPFYFEF